MHERIVETFKGWGSAPLFAAAIMASLLVCMVVAEAARWWRGRR